MPSFDVVSEVDMHELTNAVDQANREVNTRFDFKGSDAKFEQSDAELTLTAQSEFQLEQMMDILEKKMVKRGVDISSLDAGEPETTNMRARQKVTVRQGIDKELAKKIVKIVKDTKLKVQSAVQGDQVRVTGKKRDDLQQVMAMLKEQKLGLPLQYTNFRD
ncbi:YajQ family cyclic di-GMP-binding protein [Kaarinaea lacus]